MAFDNNLKDIITLRVFHLKIKDFNKLFIAFQAHFKSFSLKSFGIQAKAE